GDASVGASSACATWPEKTTVANSKSWQRGCFTTDAAIGAARPMLTSRVSRDGVPSPASLVMAAALAHATSHAAAMVVPSPASLARRAIELSNKANVDPSVAIEAIDAWTSLLETDDGSSPPLPLAAMPAAHGLFASTLVRAGRDKEAIIKYQTALAYLKESGALSKTLTKEEADVRLGMAKSLQRMLHYREASGAFRDVCARCDSAETQDWVHQTRSQAIKGAALCYMRVGVLDAAISIAESCEMKDADVTGMLGGFLLVQSSSPNSNLEQSEKLDMLEIAREKLRGGESASPLYGWLYHTTFAENPKNAIVSCTEGDDAYLSFAKCNNSPFDDPNLVNLDDKILLHSFVVEHCSDCNAFWPRGYILPNEMNVFLAACEKDAKNENLWMLKERSGYGSHGNSVASSKEVISMHSANRFDDCILCQRIVDPPMLIDGRKFSLRVYAVYFPGGKLLTKDGEREFSAEVFVSAEGLAKYASANLEDEADVDASSLDDQFMTNSGRGDGRTSLQCDLRQLEMDLQTNRYNYQELWEQIEASVQIVMKRYIGLQRERPNSYAPLCSIPKILGFDFILDASAKPFLLEVNRFPGLEPRSSMDAETKRWVVYDAWHAACERTGVPTAFVDRLRPACYKECSLKKLPV
ncbi:hypothetical protein ACHAXT_001022, partial [Thalassiosira profunda]